jgi:hypothetical protein
MSWLFSQALVEAYSEASSLDGRPSAPSNTMPTPQAFLSRDKTTDAWSRFPSGMTCEPLTEKRGEELLTWFRAVFLAPTLARPAKAGASTAKRSGIVERNGPHHWRNSTAIRVRGKQPSFLLSGLGRVLGDLAEMGYDARWGVVGAHHAGAFPHRRASHLVRGHAE